MSIKKAGLPPPLYRTLVVRGTLGLLDLEGTEYTGCQRQPVSRQSVQPPVERLPLPGLARTALAAPALPGALRGTGRALVLGLPPPPPGGFWLPSAVL